MKMRNFYAGPAILPERVLKECVTGIEDFAGMGLSVLEISHRSDEFVSVIEEARRRVHEVLNIPDDYAVLFLTGGATMQYTMTALNLLPLGGGAAIVDTGVWSSKCIKEVSKLGDLDVVASSSDREYSYIPSKIAVDKKKHTFLHITTNNTIYGTQYKTIPDVDIPLVADMSSDIFSRPIDIERYGVIYAGAQKNLGPAGTTLVIVRKDLLGKTGRTLQSILDYEQHIARDSMLNTPPVFPIYVSLLSLRWIEDMGGVQELEKRNRIKAQLLYEELDRNSLFKCVAEKGSRSLMNVCFKSTNEKATEPFIEYAAERGCKGIKGHRLVGGYRASIYNAMDVEGVQQLVTVMKEFENERG